MKSKKIGLIISLFVVIISGIIGVFIYKSSLKSDKNDLINISSLSEEFMDNYFEEVSNLKEEEKENILIVTSKEELKNLYGATNVIEAPNNQYFLQYETKEDKEKALKSFKCEDGIDISENIIHEITEDTAFVADYNSWGVEAMGLDTLKEKMKNRPLADVVVAIIDTGLNVDLFNEKYPNRLAGYYNVLDSDAEMTDEEGHGTHIAGTIAESTPDNVKIFSVKVSKTKYIYESDIITGINYIVDNDKADVMNMSFGSYGYSTGEYLAIGAGAQKNIITVAAAGNDNISNLHYPSAFDNTIAISAVDSSKQKASFSNYGEYVMFSAPGVDILSINGTMSGTSMATPHAASAVAVLKTLNKDLNFLDTITILRRYSDDIGDISWDEWYGYGFINFENAEVCDNVNCDEFNVFKKSSRDDLEDLIEDYEIVPVLTDYNYGTINNILNTKIKIDYTNGKSIEYKLYNIKNLELSAYKPFSSEEQEINIKFNTSLGLTIEDSFKVMNPSSYESVWEYNILNGNNIELTKFKDVESTVNILYIPEKIDEYTVTSIDGGDHSIFKDAWTAFSKVNYLYLPKTLTKVGDYAFSGSLGNGLSYVKSEAEKLEVGELAFSTSRSLITLDANLSYVGDYAFYWADQLMNVKFSDELTHIGDYAFYFGLNGAKLEIPESVTTIGNGAFLNSGLKEIVFKNTMETIPDSMFETETDKKDYTFNQLEKVVLPDGLKKIGNSAFRNRSNLKSINLPETLTSIGDYAFLRALSEATIIIPKDVTYLGDNVFKNSDIKEITFNNKILEIPSNMFSGMSNLEKVVLPEGLKKIGSNAFSGCSKLGEINFPDSLTEIGASAFSNAFENFSLIIPENISIIGSSAFSQSGIYEVNFENNLETLSKGMFAGSLVERVSLPDNLIEIGDKVFSGCSKLNEINFPESLTTIGNFAFESSFDVDSNLYIDIPETIVSMGTNVFDKSNIKGVKFNSNFEKIPNYTFRGSVNLEKVELPENLKEIGTGAFAACSKLKEINFSESLSIIGDSVFSGSFDVEENVSITIPETVTSFGESVFKNSNIREVVFNNELEKLPDTSFYKNLNLKRVELPENLKIIGYGAFQYSDKIQNINLPNSLTTLEASVFENCSSLNEIYFGKNISQIGYSVFDNISSDVTFYLYNDSFVENYSIENNFNYKQIDPDAINVRNVKSQYEAFETIDLNDISLELTYSENSMRTEVVSENIIVEYPEARNELRIGDTSIKLIAENELGYKIEKIVQVEVVKATPKYVVPDNLKAEIGQELKDIQLPDNFEWVSENVVFEESGNHKFVAKYVPDDMVNYKTVDNIEISIYVASKMYVVTFNANDGTDNSVSQKIEDSISTALIKNSFVRDGYTFVEWNTKADGTGTRYTNGQSVTINDNLVLFAIWSEGPGFKINKYSVDDTNKYIDLIDINTSVDEFKKNIELKSGYTVEVDHKVVNNKKLLHTGGKTKIYRGDELIVQYTNIVRGDVNGNATIDIIDYIRIMKHIMKEIVLKDDVFKAADVNQNNDIDIIDYIRIMKKIMEEN